jgi:hypothetical protein
MLNGARLIVTSFSDNLIAAKFDTGTFKDQIILIPSIIITPSDTDYPIHQLTRLKVNRLKKLAFIYQLIFLAMVNYTLHSQEQLNNLT